MVFVLWIKEMELERDLNLCPRSQQRKSVREIVQKVLISKGH